MTCPDEAWRHTAQRFYCELVAKSGPAIGEIPMQVYCRKAKGTSELNCCVCGQGYVIFWDRQTTTERAVVRAEIQELLRRQHRNTHACEAHLLYEFSVPEWQSPFQNETPVAMGDVPAWEL